MPDKSLSPSAVDQELHATEFGVTNSVAIQSGYVFCDGVYIDEPYRISRKGLGIFVNDTMVIKPLEWPPPDLRVFEEPKFPAGITENSTFEDLRDKENPLDGYLSRKMRYINMRHPTNVPQKMVETYRALPFVRSAVLEGAHIIVQTKQGASSRIMAQPLPSYSRLLSPPPTREQVLAFVESKRKNLEDMLRRGCALFLFSNGQRCAKSPKTANSDLPMIVDILEGAGSVERKIRDLNEWRLLSAYRSDRWDNFVKNFSGSAQLTARIKGLAVDLDDWKRQRKKIMDAIVSEEERRKQM